MTKLSLESSRQTLSAAYLEDEQSAIDRLVKTVPLNREQRKEVSSQAVSLIRRVRSVGDPGVMQAFLSEYGLSTREGVALMCLAEALLRVPDAETIDELIQDKIVPHDWASHVGDSGSILVNASTWGLMLTGRMLEDENEGVAGALRGMVRRLGEPVIRVAVDRAMREMGEQFVLGQDIGEAIRNGEKYLSKGYTYSYDMLGEAARTDDDARAYHAAYADAISAIGSRAHSDQLRDNPGISVKLSALHSRYQYTQRETMLPVLCERLLDLAQKAAKAGVGLNIDAEEADRLEISLDVISRVLGDESLKGWQGFGVVVQAYGQRARPLIDWLYQLASGLDRRIMVRLVKGAYWDTEIKRAQEMGLPGYPVYTRKSTTDVSYIACAAQLLAMRDRIYPQFATHNAHTISAVMEIARSVDGDDTDLASFEFQRLHGMGDVLHDIVKAEHKTRCRIYAPVGTHEDLLAYLVRRLLENGANSSFVNQIVDDRISPEEIVADPLEEVENYRQPSHPNIPQAIDLFGPDRRNSRGWDINHPAHYAEIERLRRGFSESFTWDPDIQGEGVDIRNPALPDQIVGRVGIADSLAIDQALNQAERIFQEWSERPVPERAEILQRAADLYEANAGEFFALLAREAGKTLDDAIAELREAVDFLRYYAVEAPAACANNRARGIIVCISPWNFPLAIFSGQIAAALVTGNCVVAKPAEQTPLIARMAINLLHQAGVPEAVLHCLQGPGETVGAALVEHPVIAGVCFTGSSEVAALINRQLAETAQPDAMLIAETGGLNAMIVDSTALLEQAVEDIIMSAFRSAGQRCSALRVLYVQSEIADDLIRMLKGAMDSLCIGDPLDLCTDVGPIIDEESQQRITGYCEQPDNRARILHQLETPDTGNFVSPTLIEISGIGDLNEEIFGPVLHLARFESEQLDQVISDINGAGYGLTFGLHSRIDKRVQDVVNAVKVGNLYVNRNQIGAIVGSQPFGGEGLSGTGPKAGGPHYLRRFRNSLSVNGESERQHAGVTENRPKVATIALPEFSETIGKLSQLPEIAEKERVMELRKLLRGRANKAMSAAAALDTGPVDLPGPTGESNQLRLDPVGTVLCLSHDPETLLGFVVQGLCAGNRVLAAGTGARKNVKMLLADSLPLAALDGELETACLESADIHIAAVAADATVDLGQIRAALANRSGSLVRLITEPINPAGFCHERAICIDTTAAGGNAALLAESS